MRIFDVGQSVVFVDSHGVPMPALITAIHGTEREVDGVTHYPCCNLVFASLDGSKTDPYGRQIERMTSVVHKHQQSAPGFYWMWSDEEPNQLTQTRK